MLKFLQNRSDDREAKSPIKYLPQMAYGNSYETPPQFQTNHTIFYRRSYLNPFLKFQKERSNQVEKSQIEKIHPKWTQKLNLSLVEEHKILGNESIAPYSENKSRYLDSFHSQISQNPQRFRLTRGQFTNFIEKNNHYKSIGPLQGKQRNTERIQETRKSVWLKPASKHDEMTSSLKYASSLNTTIKSSISKNSQLLTEKIRIRRNRQRIQKMFKRSLENRKKQQTQQYDLPKKGPEHQIYLLNQFNKLNIMRQSFQNSNLQENGMENLQKFQNYLLKKFK